MSYEADMMRCLTSSINREIPRMSRDLKNFQSSFNGNEVVKALEKNTEEQIRNQKQQQIANIFELCEFATKHPEYNLLTKEEIKVLLTGAKEDLLAMKKEETKEDVKVEPKKKGFFR
ncbi:MAG: hypothetical protein PHO63_00740 [Bacilli bacterium]|nr:hypothetical protein [Bacilli bacterium]MDD4809007.1 hypothetical protein [Bacilli bacterium]